MQDDGMTRGKFKPYLSTAWANPLFRWVGLFGLGILLFVVGAVGSLGQINSLAPGTMPSIWGKSDDQLWAEAFEWADQAVRPRPQCCKAAAKIKPRPLFLGLNTEAAKAKSVEEIGQFIDDYAHFPGIRQAEISRQSLLKLTLTDEEMLAYYDRHSPVNLRPAPPLANARAIGT